jgi:hypothetical protein
LTAAGRSMEDGERREMRLQWPLAALCVSISVLVAANVAVGTQSTPANAVKAQAAKRDEQTSHVTLEVSGGEANAPIENASVYLKYVEEHKILKDKRTELNVKTNRQGVAHVPTAPMGRVLIQVVADGWKTYGRWYDITEIKQTIKVHLEKPPKWY